jgi:RNA polymerase sigma-70 factor, ECF subfamily
MILLVLPDIPAEDELLRRARRGDADALREIYAAYYVPIYQFIRMRTDDTQTAEDLAADVFFKLVRAVKQQRAPRHSLRGWLFRVARNRLYDQYQRQQRFTETFLDDWLPGGDDPEAAFMRTVNIETARWALRQLTVDQQEVLLLRFGQMLSLQETADVMDKNVNAIKQLQLRALNALRRVLQPPEMEVDYEG